MSNKSILLCVLFLFPYLVFSQGEKDWWYFGFNAGLHFVGGTPIAMIDGQVNTNEGCATISDANGNLLFYTDGIKVWNKAHVQMSNGNFLKGHPSSSMSSMCIPLPGSPNLYYIFTTPDKGTGGLYYSVVDLNLNGGMGNVVAAKKNIEMMTTTCEKVTAVKNSSNTGYWVLAHEFGGKVYSAYSFDGNGVNMNAVNTSIGVSISYTNGTEAIGYMKFSPLGNKLAVAHTFVGAGAFEIFDFDANTGVLSNPIQFLNGKIPKPYGIEFSEDGHYLYVSTNNSPSVPSRVYQIDMFAGTDSAIVASATKIYENTTYKNSGALQIGPDDRIYAAVKDTTILDVIQNPEVAGSGCNYVTGGMNIMREAYLSLPNFVQGLFIPPSLSGSELCVGDTLFLNGAVIPYGVNYTWNGDNGFSASGVNASISNVSTADAGEYYFTAKDVDGLVVFSDTVTVVIHPSYLVTMADTFCKGDNYILPDGTVTNVGGVHTVFFSSIYACDSTVEVHLHEVSSSLNLGSDKIICDGRFVTFVAPSGFVSYIWNGDLNINTDSFTTGAIGNYWVNAQDSRGCWASDTVAIKAYYPKPTGFLSKDSSLCDEGEKIVLKVKGFLSYLWSDGSTGTSFTIQDTGVYSLTVENDLHCLGTESIHVREACPLEIYFPNAFTPNRDGINDVYYVQGRGIDFLELSIFDASGGLITVINSYLEGWDGTFKGKPLPEGVYTFRAKARSQLGQSIDRGGMITLIR